MTSTLPRFTPSAVAETVLDSGVVELNVKTAVPSAALTKDELGPMVLLLPVACSITVRPGSAVPVASRTVTVMVTDCPTGVVGDDVPTDEVSALGGGGRTSMSFDVALVKPLEVKTSVRFPESPLMLRSVNPACPWAFVWTVVVPDSVPPPDAMATETLTPVVVRLPPAPSCN